MHRSVFLHKTHSQLTPPVINYLCFPVFLPKGLVLLMEQAQKRSLMEVDFLRGPIFSSLLLFSIPLLISNIFQQVYNIADTMIVGHFLGDTSLAAIGACSAIYDLLIGFALGIGSGLSVVTARCYGSGDRELLKRSVACAIVIGLVTSTVIGLGGSLMLRPLLELLHTPAEIIDQSYSYISLIALFTVVMFAYNLCSGFLRAIGNSLMPLLFLIFSSVVNIGLDILFITRFDMGVQGAAIATVIAQGISAVLCIAYILLRCPLLVPKKEHFRQNKRLYREMTAQGLSMGFMSSIVSIGSVILQSSINGLGTLIIAGHTAARKLFNLFTMPISTIAMAMATFVSQNRGARQSSRIRTALKYSYVFDFVSTALIVLLLILFAPQMVQLISGSADPIVIANGARYVRLSSPFYFVLGILLQARNSLQGIGEKMLPLISSVIELLGKILFVALLIPHFQYEAVIWCEPVIWCVMTVQLVISLYTCPFMRGKEE